MRVAVDERGGREGQRRDAMVSRYGRLLDADEMRTASRNDVSVFPPSVQFRYQRELEAPQESEGFSRIDVVEFVRSPAGSGQPSPRLRRSAIASATAEDPAATKEPDPARLDSLWSRVFKPRRQVRGHPVVRRCSAEKPPGPPDADDSRRPRGAGRRGAHLRRYVEEGWRVFGVTWLPEIAEGTMSPADAAVSSSACASGSASTPRLNMPARRRSARVLVPQTAAGPGRGAPATAPARPGAMRLRWQRLAGPRLRTPAGVRVLPRVGVFRLTPPSLATTTGSSQTP